MYRDDFLKLVGPLSESEQIYKRLYELRDDYSTRMQYLASVPREKIDHLELFIPDYMPEWLELMPEVDYLFPFDTDVVFKKHYCYTPEFRHRHTYFEILYVFEGSCINTVGAEALELTTGDVCFITPGETHSLAVFDDSIIINILVKTSTFRKTFNKVLSEGGILPEYLYRCLMGKEENSYLIIHTGEDTFVRTETEFLCLESNAHHRYSGEILRSGFTLVFYYMLQNHADNMEVKYRQMNDRRILAILNYIQNNYADISLETVAGEFHYNSSYLSRLLKNMTGKSFIQLLRESRMDAACKLLRDTDYSIKEIANNVGYENVEHFNRLFHKQFEMTPRGFRKALR